MASSSNGHVGLTVKELALLLDPPMSAEQIWHLVCLAGLKPCGYRRSGQRGRPAALYNARLVMEIHALLVPYTYQDTDSAGAGSGTISGSPPSPHRQYGHHG